MFEKFGEFNSAEELNELAENLLNEGDRASLEELAKENGLDAEYVELYVQGEIPELCDVLSAAYGKLDVESKELKIKDLMQDWVEYIKCVCMENEMMALQVRSKDKSLKRCLAVILKWSFKHQQPIDKDLLKEAGVAAGRVTFGIPDMNQAKKLIRKYYLGEQI